VIAFYKVFYRAQSLIGISFILLDMATKGDKGLSVSKGKDFSEWFSEVVQKAELADLRYNVKGFLIFRPWAVRAMELMYDRLEKALQEKGHEPYWFPTVIPEGNLTKESQHLKGFTPEVFWITKGGETSFDEKLALRPTSETAFYHMFALWLRSYKQLPLKTYQRANVFRYETKATRPFLRSREFHWIETHCLFPNEESAFEQVLEDMATTQEVLHDQFGLPFIFFERPAWDKFPGANRTFAADVLNPDGKFVQQPSTHLIKQEFLKAFDVTYKDADGKDKTPYSTCYGPAISRIFASVIIVHGDDKGLRLPWSIAPYQIVIVPLSDKALKRAHEIKKELSMYRVHIDTSEMTPGEKFNTWELKGVPLRIDLGDKDLATKTYSVFRRDVNKKEQIREKDIFSYIDHYGSEYDANLIQWADSLFEGRIKPAKNIAEIKRVVDAGSVARCAFCSVDSSGAVCADEVTDKTGAQVRGTKLDSEKASGNCVVCGEKAHAIVYIGRSY
jgi:prolyl-tRNA synthetase